jgi:hypothetical protein
MRDDIVHNEQFYVSEIRAVIIEPRDLFQCAKRLSEVRGQRK